MSDKNELPETAYSEEQASEYDEYRFVSSAGIAIHEAEKKCLFHALDLLGNDVNVLEVGCGTGRLMIEVAERGFDVDGADASSSMLQEAEKKFSDSRRNTEFHLCEAANIPVEDGAYGFIYSIRLLNQTESPAYALRVIAEIIRAAEEDGYCLVEFMNE